MPNPISPQSRGDLVQPFASFHRSWFALSLTALVFAFACATPEAPAPTADPASLRTTAQGDVVGTVGTYGSHVWRGIPHAKPPVGDLRWRAPQPPESWTGTREAIAAGNHCPQFASTFGGVPGTPGSIVGDEDCLFLNIYAPQLSPDAVPSGDARMPVLFWIHGGGNVIGTSAFYDGGNLAQTHDVVVVTINYRIGPLGWFRHASLRDGDTSAADQSGNYGTLDMIRAHEWVRDNVAAFGGDPGNVTIFGESAGGTDVFSLLVSPPAAGLFHRAISQSGSTYFADTQQAEAFTEDGGFTGSSNEALLAQLQANGSAPDRAAAKAKLAEMSPAETAAFLRGLSATDLLSVYASDADEGLIEVATVFREGEVIPNEPAIERFASADTWNVVPVIAGTNRDENKLFMYGNPDYVTNWLGFIPRLKDEEGFNLEAKYRSLMWKATGSDEPATAMRASSDAVWSYRFDWDEEGSVLGADLSVMLGASHGFEIPFVFGHFDLGDAGAFLFDDDNLAGRQELSSRMMSYWVQFAATGDPGRGLDGSLPLWKTWDLAEGGDRFILFDTDAGGGLRMASDSVTQADVVALAAKNDALLAREDRCAILTGITSWSDAEVPAECAPNVASPGE
jgi:para-nitrobenzyl esterase